MSPTGSAPSTSRLAVGLALFSLYIIWGSTYLAMRVAMEGFGPFTMAAIRFLVAVVPLWMALFSGLWGRWPATKDWFALVLGFGGIIFLNLGGELRGSLIGAGVLMFATAAWAFGSLWSRRLDLPKGMMAPGAEMFAAG